jgi:threonine synthase
MQLKEKEILNIFVLHPNNKISPVQRKLMTTVKKRMFLILL